MSYLLLNNWQCFLKLWCETKVYHLAFSGQQQCVLWIRDIKKAIRIWKVLLLYEGSAWPLMNENLRKYTKYNNFHADTWNWSDASC